MPKWLHHRSIAKVLGIHLLEREMQEIDSILDGIRREYEHDFWKYDVGLLKNALAQIYGSYGADGVKYCFSHILLDTLQEYIVSERTKETLSARIMRQHASVIAFETAISVLGYIRDYIQEYYVIFEQFLSEVRRKQKEITRIIDELPEVEAQVKGIDKSKRKRERAEEIALRHGAKGFFIPTYTNFILELWNDKKRGTLTKEEWANKVLAKYRETSEKVYNDLIKIARELGYIK
ncbi:MAG: hypothetical protein QXD53_07530 [Candidatus Bathyarchaeia archaeon]